MILFRPLLDFYTTKEEKKRMSTTISPWGIGGGGTWTYITGGTVSLSTTTSKLIYSATKQCYMNMWCTGANVYPIYLNFNGDASTSTFAITLNSDDNVTVNGQSGMSRTVSRNPCTVLLNSGDSINAALVRADNTVTLYYQAFTI